MISASNPTHRASRAAFMKPSLHASGFYDQHDYGGFSSGVSASRMEGLHLELVAPAVATREPSAGPPRALGSSAWLGPAIILASIWKVTGIPATEAQALRSRGDAYRRYQETTSVFVPLPRRRPRPT